MTEIYAGIYVQELLVFPGEPMQYYMTEKIDGERVVTESQSYHQQ